PLKDQQAVSHLLAEMATRTEAARLLVYAAAAAYDASAAVGGTGPAGKGLAAKSAMAKLFATETAQFVVDAAVQIHGPRALRRGVRRGRAQHPGLRQPLLRRQRRGAAPGDRPVGAGP